MKKSPALIIIFSVIIIILVNIFAFSFDLRLCFARSKIIVPDDYILISDAINAVEEGGIVYVRSGIYRENIRLNKSIKLIGEHPETTIIDGGCHSHALDIYNIKGYVEVQGFTFRNASGYTSQLIGLSGITIFGSLHVKIFNNIIEHCTKGLEVRNSTNVQIGYNVIRNCTYGMYLSTIANLSAYANTIINNTAGVVVVSAVQNSLNIFYRNNFVANGKDVDLKAPIRWDNGAEGNYWSDYLGDDLNGDGIGDTDIPHLGLDSKPLIKPWSLHRFFKVREEYVIEVVSNTTIASFLFEESCKKLSFNSTGPTFENGFCNVTIPKALMNGSFIVLVDGKPIEFIRTENVSHIFIYFTYTFYSTKKIIISANEQNSTPKPSPTPPAPTSFPTLEVQIILGMLMALVLSLLIKRAKIRLVRAFHKTFLSSAFFTCNSVFTLYDNTPCIV
ncbi:MAG: NosD domain-containing protein [Candidatus Bathyarchaeia archaeon]